MRCSNFFSETGGPKSTFPNTRVRAIRLSPLALLLRLSPVMLALCILAACASMDPLHNITPFKDDSHEQLSRLQEQYRLQKKYDLLEKLLHNNYQKYTSEKNYLGQLYSALDLGDFYAYGFINFEKSIQYYSIAQGLNDRLKTHISAPINNKSEYFKSYGYYTKPRDYNYDELDMHIELSIMQLRRILGDSSAGKTQEFPHVAFLMTDNYAESVHVRKDIFPPETFSVFDEDLTTKSTKYFERRHKLSTEERASFMHYSVAKGLLNSFDISSLSTAQAETILQHINKASYSGENGDRMRQHAYLNFGRILCLSRMGKHTDALHYFANLQSEITRIEEHARTYTAYLQSTRATMRRAGVVKAAVGVISFPLGVGHGLLASAFSDFAISTHLKREIQLLGESEYSRHLNIVLGMDDQLQLFKSVGLSYYSLNNMGQSIFYNKEAINIINNLRSTITSEWDRISFAQYRDEIYATLIESLILNNTPEEALFYVENSRSRAFIDLLGSRRDTVLGNQEVYERLKNQQNTQIYQDFIRKQTNTSDEQAQYINTLQQSSRAVLQSSRDRENHRNTNAASVDRVNHGLSLITVQSLSTYEIQKLVPVGSSVIEYYACNGKLYAWLVENHSLKFYDLQINVADIKGHIKELEMMIRNNPNAESLRRIKETSYRLYGQIFKPLEESLSHRHIYIVPHQHLHFLPFESLYDGQQFLVMRYAIAYLPSASILQWLRPAKKRLERVLVIGNPQIDYRHDLPPLNGAQEESRLLAEHFPVHRVYLEQDATETALRREQGSYDVLHIASHAIFNAENPLESTIYLTRDQDNDGMLTARELYGIQASASVVTLSACETGLSAVRNGDELIGLMRGFFFMGSSSVTASLWKVSDDATKELMVLFYKNLHGGHGTLVQALQSAKHEMLNRPRYEHPFFWAAFNLYGLGL